MNKEFEEWWSKFQPTIDNGQDNFRKEYWLAQQAWKAALEYETNRLEHHEEIIKLY